MEEKRGKEIRRKSWAFIAYLREMFGDNEDILKIFFEEEVNVTHMGLGPLGGEGTPRPGPP